MKSIKSYFTKTNLKLFAVDTVYDIIGSVLYAVGYYIFAANADFAPGGVGGIAIIINHYLPWAPLFLCQNIINIPIAIICFKLLGKRFFVKSVKTMFFMWIFGDFIIPLFPQYGGANIAEAEKLLAAIFAGILTGAGLALIYMRGSSTGGSDFVIMSIRKKKPHMSVGSITLVIDGAIILAGGMGTRLSEETVIKPKPMVEIGGHPILWHIMKIYSSFGINDFIICLGYKGYMIKEYFANYYLHMSDLTFDMSSGEMNVHQNTAEPWRVTLVDTGEKTMTGGRNVRFI